MELSTNNVADGEVLPDLLDQIEEDIECVSADGAYDQSRCYKAIDERYAQANIPPRKDAVLHQHGNCKKAPLTRDENIRGIRKLGRKAWKKVLVITAGVYQKRPCFVLNNFLGPTYPLACLTIRLQKLSFDAEQ